MGVALGVAILLVIISVMNGFEIEVKRRLLAFSPHVTLRYAPEGSYQPIVDWHDQVARLKEFPEVSEVAGTIDDSAIIEHMDNQLPITYRGIDTGDAEQIASLDKLVIKDLDPTATAEMGLGAKALILESRANQFGINVGDTVQLYSTRNFDEVFEAYKRTERPRASEEFREQIEGAVTILREKRQMKKAPETFLYSDLVEAFNLLVEVLDADVRAGEATTIGDVLDILDSGEITGEEQEYRQLEKGAVANIERLLLYHLAKIDNTLDDNAELKRLKSIVLPKDIEIVGIYRISQQVVAPDFFLPLPIAQELSGLDEGVHALSLRLQDVDTAESFSQRLYDELDFGWFSDSWMTRYSDFFELIQLEKSMMSMVLSVVAAGASFLITIVMFLTALQKRKEIGVMLAVGAKPIQVCGIFFVQGIIIGVLGVALGVALGLLILHYRADIQMFFLMQGMDIFPAGFQGMDSLPADTPLSLIMKVGALGLFLCATAPLLPALFASRTDPAKSLRDL